MLEPRPIARDRPLTPRQAAILSHMIRFLLENQHAPSLREIGVSMQISSTNGVHDHMLALARKGYVARTPCTPTLKILRWPDGQPFTLRATRPGEEPSP